MPSLSDEKISYFSIFFVPVDCGGKSDMVVQKTQVFAIVLQVLLFVLFLYLFGFPLINKYKDEQASLGVFEKLIKHKTRSPSKAPETHHFHHLDTNQIPTKSL